MPTNTRFAGYASAVVYKNPDGTKPVQQLIWGDWLRLKGGRSGDYREVRARGEDGWMHKDDFQVERLMEVVFVDVGQGDGSLLVTPDDKHIVIDAGVSDNMARFLNWRYGGFARPWKFESMVISHPDKDHYGGFSAIFDEENVSFGTAYHSGIVERKGRDRLGRKTRSGRRSYLVDLVRSKAELERFLAEAEWRGMTYASMLKKGVDEGKFSKFSMLSVDEGYLPGYGPEEDLTVKVLGPVVEADAQGNPRLRWLGSVGKTKNGYSVVLRVEYGNVSVLLGGDLNVPSENLLLHHHTGLDAPPKSAEEHHTLVEAARRVFQVDIAKSCHHGSSDFSTTFLAAVNPIATVISSGDDEPYSHPRSDALGTTGLYSRGNRPLIFSTELARSSKELIKHPYVLQSRLKDLQREIARTSTDSAEGRKKRKRLQREFDKRVRSINRSVAVFGAIHLRTDGHRAIIAQKLERPRSKAKKWDIYRLEPRGVGGLVFSAH